MDQILAGRINELEMDQMRRPVTDADIDALPAYGDPPRAPRPDPFAQVPEGLLH